MSLVLAIEPDRAQADALRAVLDRRLGAPLTVVASKDEAVAAINMEVPDLVLVTALLSPREEDELVAHLRTLDNAGHLQLLTIPRLGRSEAPPQPKKSSLFGFGKKRPAPAPEGCDPSEFAEQVASYVSRAREARSRPRPVSRPQVAVKPAPQPADFEPSAPSAWNAPQQAVVYADPPSEPAYDPWLAPALDALPAEPFLDLLPEIPSPPVASAMPQGGDGVASEVDSLIERLGFGSDDILFTEEPLIEIDSSPDPVTAAFGEPFAPDADIVMAGEDEILVDLDAVLDGAVPIEPVPLVDLAPFRAEAEAALAVEIARVEAAGRRREAELAEAASRREAELAEAADRREAELAEATERREAERAQWLAEAEELRKVTADGFRAEAETKAREAREALTAELERVHAEAAQQRELELAQWQAEAEALREATVGRARADAEAKAREALDAELARSRAEGDEARQAEIARLQAKADERLEEVSRQAREVAEGEAARVFADELTRVRANAEALAARALEDEVSRVRAAADSRLQAELERVRQDAEGARRAEQAAAHEEAEQIRLTAAREARAVAEAAASQTLQTEIQRVRAEADARFAEQTEAQVKAEKMREAATREARTIAETAAREAKAIAEATASRALEAEIQRVRADAGARLSSELALLRAEGERRRADELEQIRREIDEMREAAAQQARSAAAEAIAAELARASTLRGTMAATKPVPVVRAATTLKTGTELPKTSEPEAPAATGEPQPASSYYDLWRAEGSPALLTAAAISAVMNAPSRFRHKRWVLPVAASLLLVLSGSVSVDTTAWRETARKAIDSAIASSTAKPDAPAVPAAPVTGNLLVETTPKGAKVNVDGKHRGQTPLTVTDLPPGKHKVVLESSDGVIIRRDVTIRAGERAVTSELMVSGWLTVFSRVPVEVHVGGRRVGRSGDPQITLAPGRHKVTFVNKQLNLRETRTIEVQAGAIASYTLSLTIGTLNVIAPAGAEVWVDGERIGDAPLRDAKVAIGTRDIVVKHPDVGEHRQTIDVRPGKPATITVGVPTPEQPGQSFDGLTVLSESKANPGMRKAPVSKPPR